MPSYNDTLDWKILNALFKQEKINFTRLGEFVFAKQSRRRHLDKLEKEKLIKSDKKANWRCGQSINYFLTEKGKKACIQNAAKEIDQAFGIVSGILEEWCNKPELFLEYRKAARKSYRMNSEGFFGSDDSATNTDVEDHVTLQAIQKRLETAIIAVGMLQTNLSLNHINK